MIRAIFITALLLVAACSRETRDREVVRLDHDRIVADKARKQVGPGFVSFSQSPNAGPSLTSRDPHSAQTSRPATAPI